MNFLRKTKHGDVTKVYQKIDVPKRKYTITKVCQQKDVP